jgi:hypothetical protein
MDVVSLGPLRVAPLFWQTATGGWALTTICRATYALEPVESTLAQEQEEPSEYDNHWDDDDARSIYAPSDLVPFKKRADVLLVGHAFAPQMQPVRSLVARLVVGDVDKSIEVCHDRTWTQDGQLREGARFLKMPLRYERAAGGPETTNPVGIPWDAPPDPYGMFAIPNLQPPGLLISHRSETFVPIGFGPIAPGWPTRVERLLHRATGWSHQDWSGQPLPNDIDAAYFNSAPRDQQIEALRPNERITIENLHPEHARLTTSLPGVRPRAMAERGGRAPEEIAMICDTLWIDTDRSLCALVWRGTIQLGDRNEAGRVVVSTETMASRDTRPERPNNVIDGGKTISRRRRNETGPIMPFVSTPPDSTAGRRPRTSSDSHSALPFVRPAEPRGRATPFRSEPKSSPPAAHEIAAPDTAPSTLSAKMLESMVPAGGATPWSTSEQQQPAMASPMPPPMAPTMAAPMAPAMAPPMTPAMAPPMAQSMGQSMVQPMAQPIAASPWGSPDLDPSKPVNRETFGQMAAASEPGAAAPNMASAVAGGAVAASNAAAWTDPSLRAPTPAASQSRAVMPAARGSSLREVLGLIWFDPAFLGGIRDNPSWKPILRELAPKADAPEDWFAEEEKAKESPETIDRRQVFGVLARGSPTDVEGINEALLDAVADDGTITPPLVLLAGELLFPFDELETLKATVTAVTPLIAGDKKLKETVDTVNELLKTPWLQRSSGVAEGLTGRVKEAFAQGNRMLPPSYLDSHTERMLLEERHYQKRTVFGELWIRSLLHPMGSQDPMPAYLPDSLTKQLPMMQRMKARLIAEVHMQQDQYETNPSALRVVALARVGAVASGRRRDSGRP